MFCRRIIVALVAATLALPGGCNGVPGTPAPDQSRPQRSDAEAIAVLRDAAIPLGQTMGAHDQLMGVMGGAQRILLGESTHGTHEYYVSRAEITLRLVREHGVNAIAVEGDWTPTQRLNQYVRGLGPDETASQAMAEFNRFPRWMWPNHEFRNFVEQLRAINLTRSANQRVGLYGMDVYDLFEAADEVTTYLKRVRPTAANFARARYRCFASYGRNTHSYGAAARDAERSCQDEAAQVLGQMRAISVPIEPLAAEAHFNALRSAESVAAAEEYFRTAYSGRNAWNVRDERMARTVEEIAGHVQRQSGRPGKVVMWSHNTHSGDARATFAASQGELNIGQLMKQRHGAAAFSVGYFSYAGTVFAAAEWDQPGRVFQMREALPGSYSHLFHQTGMPAFLLVLGEGTPAARQLSGSRLERAIGVVYVPSNERRAHYFEADLSDQFDAVIFFDRTKAVQPLR